MVGSSTNIEDIKTLDKISIAILKMMREKPVYDLETHRIPEMLLEILKKADMDVADIELAVSVAEEVINEPKRVEIDDYSSLFDIIFEAKHRLKNTDKTSLKED